MHQPSDLWLNDGSLRDAYILGAEPKDWCVLMNLAISGRGRYSADGVVGHLPTAECIFANRELSHLLQMKAGAASINCHFFVPTEIELDIDPREVVDEATHGAVLSFLESLSFGAGKGITITAENSPESPLLTFNPLLKQWQVHAAPFSERGVRPLH
jgi:hypothetical protein